VAAGFVEVRFMDRAFSTIVFVRKVFAGWVLEEGQGLVYFVVEGTFRLGVRGRGKLTVAEAWSLCLVSHYERHRWRSVCLDAGLVRQ
jgi:hypothetical protein